MTKQLIISDTTIRMDAEGRYCLNDLHKAAGGKPKHRPGEWLKTHQTQELVAEISSCEYFRTLNPVNVILGKGKEQGTYVCKELVYAYAMWISPAFHLKVIRAYDTLQTQGVAVADNAAEDLLTNPMKYFRKLVEQAEKLQEERDRIKAERDGVVKLVGTYTHTINRVVRMLPGVNTLATKGDLLRLGYLYRTHNHYRVYAKYRHLFVEKFDETTGRGNIFCTPEGKAELTRLYEAGKLTTKVGYRSDV